MTENMHPNNLQVAKEDKPTRNAIVVNEAIREGGTTSKGSKKMVWSKEVRLQTLLLAGNPISIACTQSHIDTHIVSLSTRIQEDERLRQFVAQAAPNTEPKWTWIAEQMGTIRSSKQCRERWRQNLRPGLVKGNWTAQEDFLIAQLQGLHGNR